MKYFKACLEKVVETQEAFFDSFAMKHQNSSTNDFIDAYMRRQP